MMLLKESRPVLISMLVLELANKITSILKANVAQGTKIYYADLVNLASLGALIIHAVNAHPWRRM